MDQEYAPVPGGASLVAVGLGAAWFCALVAGVSLGLWAGLLGVAVSLGTTWLFGVRLALGLRVDAADGVLRWRSMLTRAEIPTTDVERVRPARFERSMLVLEGRGRRGVVLAAGPGLGALVDALRVASPTASIELGTWAGRLEELDRRRDVRR